MNASRIVELSRATLVAAPLGLLLAAAPVRAQHLIAAIDGPQPPDDANAIGYADHVAGLGDTDGDGVPDVACSGYDYSTGPGVRTVRLFSGADGHVLHAWQAPTPAETLDFGTLLVATGDVDGDGVSDLAIGDRHLKPTVPATARVYSGADGHLLLTLQMVETTYFVSAIGAPGDIDGDGHADVALSAVAEGGAFSTRVTLFSGADGSILATLEDDGSVGDNVAGPGDLDGDGTPDLVVVGHDVSLRAWSGATLLPGHAPASLWNMEISGPAHGAAFGAAISGLGDVDGDGHADLVVTQLIAPGPGPQHGVAYVLSGADGSILHTVHGEPSPLFDEFGMSASGLGDANGDGSPDFAVGDSKQIPPSFVRVFSGADGQVLATVWNENLPFGKSDGLGSSVAGVGDVDGDSLPDFAAGAWGADQPPSDHSRGRLYVFGLRGSWTWLGQSLAGSTGTPVLIGEGKALPNAPLSIELANAKPGTAGWLMVGWSVIAWPFKGGTLVPLPALVAPFGTDADGRASFSARWPDEAPPGFGAYLQAWIADGVAPAGWAASCAERVGN